MIAQRYRLAAQVAGLLAAGLLLAFVLFRLTLYEAPRPPARAAAAAAPAPAGAPLEAIVLSVEGDVEHGREGGTWSALAPGETVQTNEVLRTGAHGKTDLRIDERSHLTIAESSEVSVRELTTLVHRFRLTRGRMTADYDPQGQRVLRVEDESGDSVAETQAARFSVLSTGTTIAVAPSSGAVSLRSAGRAVSVGGGEMSYAARGLPPALPRRIPTAVVLKVANAISSASATVCAEVRGEAMPGSQVLVDGQPTGLDPEGRFRKRVARTPGKREVLLEIVDPAGRRRTQRMPCVALSAPIKDMAIRWNEGP